MTVTRAPLFVIPVTSTSSEPIMKSMCTSLALIRCHVGGVGDRGRVRVAEREVARRVLVEKRRVEGPAELADAALAVDERDLAEA